MNINLRNIYILTLVSLSLLVHLSCSSPANGINDELENELFDVIQKRPQYLKEKEARLSQKYNDVQNAKNDRDRFDALTHLYEEYHSFNTDSAYSITLQQEALAQKIGDTVLIENARLNKANVFASTGMYHETLELIDSVNFNNLPDYLHPFYYHIKRTVYGYLEDFATFEPEKSRYHSLTNDYRDSIMSVHIPQTLSYAITKADFLNVNGEPKEAVNVMTSFMNENDLSEHDRAICAWTLSESFAKLGDKKKQKEQLLISSISDLKSSVREYVSLRELAIMLYEEGESEKAYQLMSIAIDDASKSNSRQRIIEINDYYPQINGIYIDKITEQKTLLTRTLIIIAVLVILLISLLLFVYKQMQRISKDKEKINEAYLKLNDITEKLKSTNDQLKHANNDIEEISELKEVYIGNYMEQCLVYIEKLDDYRKKIAKLANSGKFDDIKKITKSDAHIADELKLFYKQFDKTFLNIFPSFVSDLNELLRPEDKYTTKKDGTLNTELRIYALIRLGITDSSQIAKFLQYSLTTIYNYRVKVRNKAKGDRDNLESQVMKMGRKY